MWGHFSDFRMVGDFKQGNNSVDCSSQRSFRGWWGSPEGTFTEAGVTQLGGHSSVEQWLQRTVSSQGGSLWVRSGRDSGVRLHDAKPQFARL